jgi:hypothetical protein
MFLLYYTPDLLPGHRSLFINFLGYRPTTCERGTGPSLSQGNSKVACMGGRPYGGGAYYSFMCSFFSQGNSKVALHLSLDTVFLGYSCYLKYIFLILK